MRAYTILELIRMTKTELCRLLTEAELILKTTATTEPEHTQAKANISAIRSALQFRRQGPVP